MDDYDTLLDEMAEAGVVVDETVLQRVAPDISGVYGERADGRPPMILVNGRLGARARLCVLAEEVGHHYRSAGVSVGRDSWMARKSERAGREWAYSRLASVERIASAIRSGCTTEADLASALGVTRHFLRESIAMHKRKCGISARVGDDVLRFEPFLSLETKTQSYDTEAL